MRGRLRNLLVILALWLGLTAGPAHAQPVPLSETSCVGSADSQATALALSPDELDCGPNRFRATGRFVRVHSDLTNRFLPPGQLYWQTDPSVYDSLALLVGWSDGTTSWIDVDPGMAVRNWAATARFSVVLPQRDSGVRPLAIDMVVENPRMLATMRDARLTTQRDAARDHFTRALVATLVCGLLIAPIFYTLYYYRVMRAPFMLWHGGMSFGMALFVASNAGLLFELFPRMTLAERWQLNSTSITFAVVAAVAFTVGMLEKGMLGLTGRRVLYGALIPLVLAKLAVLIAPLAVRTTVGWHYALSFLPLMIALPWTLAVVLRRGSRAALYALVGFGALALAGFVMMIDGIGLIDAGLVPEDAMLGAMVVMSLITSAGVGDRFMILRAQLERERRRAAELGALAFSDGLTGLANRRAFDARGPLMRGEALLVADLDHFKAINDKAGHSAGDEALCHVARVLQENTCARPDCIVYRLGGEEFGVVMPHTGETGLREQCEELRRAIAAAPLSSPSGDPLTISIGAVAGQGQPIAEAFRQADQAMYWAKAEGRNCTRLASDAPPRNDDFDADPLRLSRI